MDGQVVNEGSDLIGREPELALLREFLSPQGSHRAMLITGEAGIGKSTIWDEGLSLAREQGLHVLSARPSDAEAQLSFATLGDLLREVDAAGLRSLPSPQRHALEVALLRAEPGQSPPEQRAIALGFLNALESIAVGRPTLVAIDDVQWVDRASSEALAYAIRRLSSVRVRFLVTQRSGTEAGLLGAFETMGVERLTVEALSLGALRRVLFERLGLSLTRRDLRRVFESAQGNPLFALELGRSILERKPAAGETLVVPARIEEMLGMRVSNLAPPLRRLLVAVALCPTVTLDVLSTIADVAELDNAVDAGLLLLDGKHARASHPLLAAAAMRHSDAKERRDIQRALADVVGDEQLRAKLLAGAATRQDADLATTIAAAATGAALRGAIVDAVLLAEQALRLTPTSSPLRTERVLEFARFISLAGQRQRMVDFLTSELDSLPPGAATAEAFYCLASEALDPAEIKRHVESALAESPNDLGLRTACTALTCLHGAVIQLLGVELAERRLRDALPYAHLGRPELEQEVLLTLIWINALRGYSVNDLVGRFPSVPVDRLLTGPTADRTEGQRLVWRGAIPEARALLTRLMGMGDELGELMYALHRLHVCELELRSGEWAAAEHLLAEWEQSADGALLIMPMFERCRALLAAGVGDAAAAEEWANAAISRARAAWGAWDQLESLRALGIASLLVGEPGRAAERLRIVWEHTQREGIADPGTFPAAPDLVEALVELGELEEGRRVTARLLELSEQQEHPWGLITSKRCDALIRLASDPEDAARHDLQAAAAAYGSLGLRFDRARCLLALGRAERRGKKWAAARESLEQAAAAFDEIGSVGWAEQARSELARVGARKPQPKGRLTGAEERTATLAAQGLANKEIAAALHVSVHTVEVHLSRAYAKLGIRSRSQLAARLSTQT